MTAVNLSDKGQETLKDIRDSFDIKPSKRKVVERALDTYWEERQQNTETTNNE